MLQGLVLVAVVLLAAVSGTTGIGGAAALALASVAWLLVNGTMEGAVLWVLVSGHGLTSADLAGLAGLGVAGWRWAALAAARRAQAREQRRSRH
jgi:membrane-bound ClpP family serine protease